MKKTIMLIGLVAASLGSASAATIAISGGSSTQGFTVTNASGNAIGASSYFAIGYYTAVPTITNGASLLTAVSNLNIFASGLTGAGPTYKMAASFTNTTVTGADSQQIYFVLGNGTTQANSTQFALFTTSAATLFPANITAAGSTNISLTGATGATTPVMLANAGTATPGSGAPGTIKLVDTVVVPEPSAALLGGLGLLGLLRRRR
jgi:hypothetical protein